MLTVKWIGPNGCEFIYEGRDIGFSPGEKDRKAVLAFYQADNNSHTTIDTGRVFVMNDKGRTIADYILENPDWPHGKLPKHD